MPGPGHPGPDPGRCPAHLAPWQVPRRLQPSGKPLPPGLEGRKDLPGGAPWRKGPKPSGPRCSVLSGGKASSTVMGSHPSSAAALCSLARPILRAAPSHWGPGSACTEPTGVQGAAQHREPRHVHRLTCVHTHTLMDSCSHTCTHVHTHTQTPAAAPAVLPPPTGPHSEMDTQASPVAEREPLKRHCPRSHHAAPGLLPPASTRSKATQPLASGPCCSSGAPHRPRPPAVWRSGARAMSSGLLDKWRGDSVGSGLGGAQEGGRGPGGGVGARLTARGWGAHAGRRGRWGLDDGAPVPREGGAGGRPGQQQLLLVHQAVQQVLLAVVVVHLQEGQHRDGQPGQP